MDKEETREFAAENCEGKKFYVGDNISGLYGFGTFVSGIIRKTADNDFCIINNKTLYKLSCFEGGFDTV